MGQNDHLHPGFFLTLLISSTDDASETEAQVEVGGSPLPPFLCPGGVPTEVQNLVVETGCPADQKVLSFVGHEPS